MDIEIERKLKRLDRIQANNRKSYLAYKVRQQEKGFKSFTVCLHKELINKLQQLKLTLDLGSNGDVIAFLLKRETLVS